MPRHPPAKRSRILGDNPHVQGDMGQHHILKPVGNKDVPADATITNIKVMGGDFGGEPFVNFSAKPSIGGGDPVQNQQQSLIFEFKEEECPNVCPLVSDPMALGQQEVPVQRIFDIDMEYMLKRVEEPTSNLLQSIGTSAAVHKYVDHQGTPGGSNYDIQMNGWLPPTVLTDTEAGRSAAGFCLTVIPRSKQKILGDWIQKFTATVGSNVGSIYPMTVQLFDDLNYEVKPIYSAQFIPRQENEAPKSRMQITETGGVIESIPIPEQSPYNKLTWELIEFHRFQDSNTTTSAESYANSLLISVIGPKASFKNFDELKLRIFHKPEMVQRQQLDYWATNISRFMFETASGSRHKYGDDVTGVHNDNGNWEFHGTITSQIGNIIPVGDMAINLANAETNILQDTAETARVPGWYY